MSWYVEITACESAGFRSQPCPRCDADPQLADLGVQNEQANVPAARGASALQLREQPAEIVELLLRRALDALERGQDLVGGDRAHIDPLLGGVGKILRIAVGGRERRAAAPPRAPLEYPGGAANGRDSL